MRQALAPARLKVRRALKPASPEQIISQLSMLADMLQVTLPTPDGLKIYVACLQTVPAHALRHALMQVAMTHRYPRLPLPAEILDHCRVKDVELRYWLRYLDQALALIGE